MVISTLIGVISSYKYSYIIMTLLTESHDPFSSLNRSSFCGLPYRNIDTKLVEPTKTLQWRL